MILELLVPFVFFLFVFFASVSLQAPSCRTCGCERAVRSNAADLSPCVHVMTPTSYSTSRHPSINFPNLLNYFRSDRVAGAHPSECWVKAGFTQDDSRVHRSGAQQCTDTFTV